MKLVIDIDILIFWQATLLLGAKAEKKHKKNCHKNLGKQLEIK